ncbi:glycosyl transferase, group 1 [Candidatus Magnetobacterium bavaricum]|uniref:Glycosyl transferase, group 1 n=1 Tax=Candidatus Magnetobacterium bavaricum TaxID=29290 RepID=A0A0F3H200_9BACT|nr:glycosyl transferase, group 1 [Candidatus Magnetobacterium bavaricum]
MKYPGARDGYHEGLRHVFVGIQSRSLTAGVFVYTVKAGNYVRKHGRDFDVIVENFLPSTPFFARYLTRTPVILQVQGIMERHAILKFNPLYSVPMYGVEQFYPGLYDRFIFVSEVTMRKVTSRMTKKHPNCIVIPNDTDERLLNTPVATWCDKETEDNDYILFFSRIDTYTKGLDLLVKAFEEISPRYPTLKLILAGHETDPVARLCKDLTPSVRRKVIYAGFVGGDDKARLLSGARIFVLPSRHESSPISIIEAAACGKAIVVSDIEELAFVQRHNMGLSFRCGDHKALSAALLRLLDDTPLRLSLGEAARAYAKTLLWDNIALIYEDYLTSAIESTS